MDKPEPPHKLEYAKPSAPRSFQDALTDFVALEMAEGRLSPPSKRRRLLGLIVFGLVVVVIVMAILISELSKGWYSEASGLLG